MKIYTPILSERKYKNFQIQSTHAQQFSSMEKAYDVLLEAFDVCINVGGISYYKGILLGAKS